MAKVIIFGMQDLAQLAHYYLRYDTRVGWENLHEVVAFSVHEKYLNTLSFSEKLEFEGKPLVPFEKVEKIYPPEEYKFFAPMTGAQMNKQRESVYQQIKQKGYSFISYISSKATKFNTKIGENCFILENNTLQPFTTIGNNVVMWSGNHIGHHSVIGDHVFFASHTVLSGHCNVGSYSWFGVNSTIRDGLTIAEGSLIAMGACIIKNTEPWSAYAGLPARKLEKTSLEANP